MVQLRGCPETGSLVLERLVHGGTTAWRQILPGWRWTEPVPDVDGDGDADLLGVSAGDDRRHFAVSGRRGDLLWERPSHGHAVVAGAISGGPGGDLLVIEVDESSDDPSLRRITLERVQGRTGETLFSTEHHIRSQYLLFSLFVADVDRDGVADLGINAGWPNAEGVMVSSVLVESTRGGSIVYQHANEGISWTFPGGDFDADGYPELLVLSEGEQHDGQTSLTLEARDTMRETMFWSRRWSARSVWSLWLTITEDMSGSGGDDLLLTSVDEPEGDGLFRVQALEGRTGTPMWILS